MKKKYFVIVEKELDSCYGVFSPDFKTVMGAGSSFAEACRDMREAMELYLRETKEVPEAKDIEAIETYILENYPTDSMKTVVSLEVDLPQPHSRRINISMPEYLLNSLDQRLAGKTNQRSRFIARAVEKQLQNV